MFVDNDDEKAAAELEKEARALQPSTLAGRFELLAKRRDQLEASARSLVDAVRAALESVDRQTRAAKRSSTPTRAAAARFRIDFLATVFAAKEYGTLAPMPRKAVDAVDRVELAADVTFADRDGVRAELDRIADEAYRALRDASG